jgi:hypothetical protein
VLLAVNAGRECLHGRGKRQGVAKGIFPRCMNEGTHEAVESEAVAVASLLESVVNFRLAGSAVLEEIQGCCGRLLKIRQPARPDGNMVEAEEG